MSKTKYAVYSERHQKTIRVWDDLDTAIIECDEFARLDAFWGNTNRVSVIDVLSGNEVHFKYA